jgi:hypothetical protein
MIPIWVPKRRYPDNSEREIEFEVIELPRSSAGSSKECAICRRQNADYEHSCGVAFHKACIEQYFDAISGVDGAERICPHCYAPVPLSLEPDKEAAIEVSPIPEEVYNQYLELSDEFSLALMEGNIRDVSVFLSSPTDEQYFVNIDFGYYPRKPTFSFPDELLTNIEGLYELLDDLNSWDYEFPPRLVEVLYDIQSRIKPGEREEMQEPKTEEIEDIEESNEEIKEANDEQSDEFVEVFPEGDIVEVTAETGEVEEVQEVEEILPSTFFELDSIYETEVTPPEPTEDAYENEEAIKQYLDLSNSFSVELIEDKVYHTTVYLSSLDAGIYNIYPIIVNFRDYPKKPIMTFTDDLLVRIRDLDEILDKLRHWDNLIPSNLADIIQQMELRLVEDSLVESEFEVIRREYRTKRLSKNKIMVTLSTYGPRYIDCELDLTHYPQPPTITLPDDLGNVNIEELEGIRNWQNKPQKRIMDVLRSLSQLFNNMFRMDFEEQLLKMVAEDFTISDGEYHLRITVPETEDNSTMDTSEPREIQLQIKISGTYPLTPPEIKLSSNSEELEKSGNEVLNEILKSWAPSMFLADAANRISLSLWNTSLYKCLICGSEECPTCHLPLLTMPVEEAMDLCEIPCIQCKRPYHVHCLTHAMGEGDAECGYCLTDMAGFLGKKFFRIVGE